MKKCSLTVFLEYRLYFYKRVSAFIGLALLKLMLVLFIFEMCIRDRSVRAVTGKPIMFTGVGEKLDELDEFHPDRMASRILGMGDVLSLIERVESEIDQKQAEETAKRLEQNKFDMNDLLSQFQQIKKMGSIKSLLSMLPGDVYKRQI